MSENGWRHLKFRELCASLVNGGTPDTGIERFWNGTIPWITGADFANQSISQIRRRITTEALQRSATNIIAEGNILLVTRTGVGKIAIAPFDVAISQDITGVNFKEDVDVSFMFHCLQLHMNEFQKLNQGTSINGILKDDLLEYPIDIPPLPEQRKIAKILTTMDNLIEKTEALIAKYQAIKQGMMHDLFTRGVDEHGQLRPPYEEAPELYKESELGWIPREWEVVPLVNFAAGSSGAFVNGPFGSDLLTSELTNEGVPVIYVRDIKAGLYERVSTVHVTEQKANQLNVCNVVHNDVLIAKVGDPPCDAAPYLEAIRAVVTQDVIRIRPTTGVDTLFLSHLMNSSIGRDAVRQITIEGTRARVSLTELKALTLPKPPFLEQKIMGKRLESLQARISRAMESVVKLQAIKTGLMQDLLTGKVRVNVDKAEETSS